MDRRGTNHVLLDSFEILKRIRKPGTVKLIENLMWFYEEHSRRKMMRETGAFEMWDWDDHPDFLKLMEQTRTWLQPPLTLDFGAANAKNRKRRHANGSGEADVTEKHLQQTARRSRNRKRRKDSVERLRRSS